MITAYPLIRESNDYSPKQPVLCILYYLVKTDTNNDKKLTSADKRTIAISNPDGTGYQELLTDVTDVLGYEIIEQESIGLMFTRNDNVYIQHISISELKNTKLIEFPKLN